MRDVFRSLAKLTTTELGKHGGSVETSTKTVVLCTCDDISPKDLESEQQDES